MSKHDWSLDSSQTWAAGVATFEREAEGPVVVLSGSCPCCGHPMAAAVAVGPVVRMGATPKAFGSLSRRGTAASGEYVVWCNCTVDHKGRPTGEVGCGSFGLLLTASEPANERRRPGYWWRIVLASFLSVHLATSRRTTSRRKEGESAQVTAPQRHAFVDDLLWAKKLDAGAVDALDNTRAAAAKWAPTITAITGIYSAFALIKGRSDITALTHGWEIGVGFFVAVAATFSLRSIVLAALAAEGTPSSVAVSATSIRAYFAHAVDVAQWQLLASRVTAVLAAVCIGAAIGIVWFAPQPALLHAVKFSDGTSVCGVVAVNPNGTLKVTTPAGKAVGPSEVAPADVTSIASVPACP